MRLGGYRGRGNLLWTAAAALSTTVPTAMAFVVSPSASLEQSRQRSFLSTTPASSSSFLAKQHHHQPLALSSQQQQQTTRLYSRRTPSRDDEPGGGGGLLGGLKKAAKSILPSSWFQSEKEKKAAIERQRVKDDLEGGLQELFRDAPFPVRMMGKMVTPLMTNVMSGLAETMAEQQQSVNEVLQDAESYLRADPSVAAALGSSLQVGVPFSQSSSTTSINGQTTSQVQLQFPVTGSRQSGVAQAVSANGQLQRLDLSVGGRTIPVSLIMASSSAKTSSSSSFRRNKPAVDRNDDIIEAEIIEKDVKP